MDIAQTGLQQQPFHTRGQPVVFVEYRSQQAAHDFLQMVLHDDRGTGVLYGPESSGKRTLIRHFMHGIPEDTSVAVVDGARLKTVGLLEAVLTKFNLNVPFVSADSYWNAIREFLADRTLAKRAPLLVLENIGEMYPSALYALCKLAELKVRRRYAIRMILVNNKVPFAIMHAPSMTAIAKRAVSAFELGPMTRTETSDYLCTKLRASGCADPDKILPADIRNELHTATGGWPGKLDGLAMRAIRRAENWPIRREHLSSPAVQKVSDSSPLTAVVEHSDDPEIQRLFLTLNRKTLREIDLTDSKVLIGRSELCDVSIESRFVSKHHALLVRTDNALHILDLNSTNGTFVNSHRIQSNVLRHEDVISIGNHGIKLICPAYRTRPVTEELDLADTTTMKTLADMRRLKDKVSGNSPPAEKQEG